MEKLEADQFQSAQSSTKDESRKGLKDKKNPSLIVR